MNISVVIPCYNAELYIGQTINSILQQTKPPQEIIVVDDGSTDDSLNVIKQFDEHIHLIKQQQQGAAAARNRGAANTEGDAIMFLDADDVLSPDSLEGLANALKREPATIAIGPWRTLVNKNEKWVSRPKNSPPRRFGQDDLSAWLTGWFHTPCSVLWSRVAFEKTGKWDESVNPNPNDDGEIMMRAMVKGVKLSRASFGTGYYRRLNASHQSLSDFRHSESGIQARIYVVDKIAQMLEDKNDIKKYRGAIAESFELIADDCERFPGLKEQCLTLAKKYGSHRTIRFFYRSTFEFLSKLHRAYQRITLWNNQKHDNYDVEITYGERAGENSISSYQNDDLITSTTQTPQVSVIIPTYNRKEVLKNALKSVLEQTYQKFELIIVDDGSTDGTQKLIEEYQNTDPRIRYFRHNSNFGASKARNTALKHSRGKYIAFLDSDDEWYPEKLEIQIAKFEELSENVGLLYTGVETFHTEKKPVVHIPEYRGKLFNKILYTNVVYGGGSNAVIRSSVVSDIGYIDEKMPANEDWDYWIRVARDYEIEYVDDVLIKYHKIEGNNRKSLIARDDLDARDRLYKKYKYEMQNAGIAVDFLLESSRRHLVPAIWDPSGARLSLSKSFRLSPLNPSIFITVLRSYLPFNLYLYLRKKWRAFLN